MLVRSDIEAFLRRMAFLTSTGRVSPDARTRICREVRHLLGRLRALGLARTGGPAAGLGGDFTLVAGDVPIKPEDPEPNRDLPVEIMAQLCAQLPLLEHSISCREIRVAVELIIDTGRRPDEICALSWDCLEYDPDRSPVLVYDWCAGAELGRWPRAGHTWWGRRRHAEAQAAARGLGHASGGPRATGTEHAEAERSRIVTIFASCMGSSVRATIGSVPPGGHGQHLCKPHGPVSWWSPHVNMLRGATTVVPDHNHSSAASHLP